MVLESGILPYDYDAGRGPFRVETPSCNGSPIGLSGTLLEQAQFAVTAELRRWRGNDDPSALSDFNVYRHEDSPASGPYEPTTSGANLASSSNPGSMIFVDHILETRAAMEDIFEYMAYDSSYNEEQMLTSWLSALYPNNPSGQLGFYTHRSPSAVGAITEISDEVLGSSGVLYDVDIGEVMYNPFPHIGQHSYGNAHGTGPAGENAVFDIRIEPFFPAFQKTNGTLIGLNGREPDPINVDNNGGAIYDVDPISSGTVRLDGYMLTGNSEYYLGRNGNNFDRVEDFTPFADSTRSPDVFAERGMSTTREYLTPTTEGSGIYRVAVRNPRSVFPNTTIESGVTSFWPTFEDYWPSGQNSSAGNLNLGYEVFDDALWMTDIPFAGATNVSRYPSGLAVLSPFTGHRMWTRFAELVNETHATLGKENNWPLQTGLEYPSSNTVIRISEEFEFMEHPDGSFMNAASGRIAFIEYDDNLDYVDTHMSTSTTTVGIPDFFPTGGTTTTDLRDMCFDGTFYWVTNGQHVGFDLWKFDDTFSFIDKYNNRPAAWVGPHTLFGLSRWSVGAIGGSPYVYHGYSGVSLSLSGPITQSGIFPLENFTGSPGDPGEHAAGGFDLGQRKDIDGAAFFGFQRFARIMDLYEVTNGTHTPNGVYAIVRWNNDFSVLSDGIIALVRIEEEPNRWAVKAAYKLSNSSNGFFPGDPQRMEIFHKDI